MGGGFVDDYYRQQIELARSGNSRAAVEILKEFCEAVEDRQIPNSVYLEYLAECFSKILDGITAAKALRVQVGNRASNFDERRKAALRVASLRLEGFTVEKACEMAEAETAIKFSSIERTYWDNHKTMDMIAAVLKKRS